MTKELKEELIRLICDYENGEDQIEPLHSIEHRIKNYLKHDKNYKAVYQERLEELKNHIE